MDRQRILIVDDDESVRDSLHDELHDHFDVETASCGGEALNCLARASYDVVISDLRMPDISGVEVLERARHLQPDIIRILLTGYLDEGARRATLEFDAPFKISKPWHDALEVTLHRSLEQRDRTRELTAALEDAAKLAHVDDEFAAAEGLAGLAPLLVARARVVKGVEALAVVVDVAGVRRELASFVTELADSPGKRWQLDEGLTGDGSTRVLARGVGSAAKKLIELLIACARRWTCEEPLTRLARLATADPLARQRLLAVARRSTLGGMTAGIVHELASLLQYFSVVAKDLEPLLDTHPQAADCLRDATSAAERILSLFRALRSFVHTGAHAQQVFDLDKVVRTAQTLLVSHTRGVRLQIAPLPSVRLQGDPTLILQVLVNLICNAADASPPGGTIDVEASVQDGVVQVTVTDDGAGVPEAIRAHLFEAFATSKGPAEGTGLGLALSAQIVHEHGGTLEYFSCPGRGARFVVRLPSAR